MCGDRMAADAAVVGRPTLLRSPVVQRMTTRQQGIWRKYARPSVVAKDWDDLLLSVSVLWADVLAGGREGGRSGGRLQR